MFFSYRRYHSGCHNSDIAFALPLGAVAGHRSSGINHQHNIMLADGDIAFYAYLAAAGGRPPFDIFNVVPIMYSRRSSKIHAATLEY